MASEGTDNPITLPLDYGWPRAAWLWSLFMATGEDKCDAPDPLPGPEETTP